MPRPPLAVLAERLGLPPAPEGWKYCGRCVRTNAVRVPYPLTEFSHDRNRADGSPYCRSCRAERRLEADERAGIRAEARRVRALASAARADRPGAPLLPALRSPAPPLVLRAETIRPSRYETLFRLQVGRCVVCEQPETRRDEGGLPHPLTYIGVRGAWGFTDFLCCGDCDEALKKLRYHPRYLSRALMALLPAGRVATYEATLHED